MTERLVAPWTNAQVAALNRFQRYAFVHPFTCLAITHPGDKMADKDRVLVATNAGWVCPSCDYTQNWAHAVMVEDFGALKIGERADPFGQAD